MIDLAQQMGISTWDDRSRVRFVAHPGWWRGDDAGYGEGLRRACHWRPSSRN